MVLPKIPRSGADSRNSDPMKSSKGFLKGEPVVNQNRNLVQTNSVNLSLTEPR